MTTEEKKEEEKNSLTNSDIVSPDISSLNVFEKDSFGMTSLNAFEKDSFDSTFGKVDAEWSVDNLLLRHKKCFGNDKINHTFDKLISWLKYCALTNEEAKIILEFSSSLVVKSDDDEIKKVLEGTSSPIVDVKIYSAILDLVFHNLLLSKSFCKILSKFELLKLGMTDSSKELFGIVYYVVGYVLGANRQDCQDCQDCRCDGQGKQSDNQSEQDKKGKEYTHIIDHFRAGYYLLESAKRNILDGQASYALLVDPDISCYCAPSPLSCILPDECNPSTAALLSSSAITARKRVVKNIEQSLKWYEIAAENGNSVCRHNLAEYYGRKNTRENNLDKLEHLYQMIIDDGELEFIEEEYYNLFFIKLDKIKKMNELFDLPNFDLPNFRQKCVELIDYCFQCAEKRQLWAMAEYANICWGKNEQLSPYFSEKDKGLETGLKYFHRIIVHGYSALKYKNSRTLDSINEKCVFMAQEVLCVDDEQIIKNVSSNPHFIIKNNDFGPWLYYAKDVQYVLSSVLKNYLVSIDAFSTIREDGKLHKQIVAHFVYNYGLDWKYFYRKYPVTFYPYNENGNYKAILDVENVTSVNVQHYRLTKIYKDMKSFFFIMPKDIFNLIGDYIVWFPLVSESDRLTEKKRKTF